MRIAKLMVRICGMTAAAALAVGCTAGCTAALAQDKVVYHFSSGLEQASDGLRNIRNHLEVDPKAKIVVVAHARGVDFLMKGAKDPNGNRYQDIVENLKNEGDVSFRICEITLRDRKLKREQFIEEAGYVPSGVAEITRLQVREHYAYLKP